MNITKTKCYKCGYIWLYKGKKTESTCPKCRKWIKIQKPANAGKNHKKMTVEEMLKQPHYLAILNFTLVFGNKEGLRQSHYRWELIKNHDNIKQTYLVNEMKNFFKESENKNFFLSYIFTKTYISSRSNLSNFLKKLEKNNLLNKVKDSDKIGRYFLTDKSEAYLLRHNLIELFELLPLNYIKKIYYDLSEKFLDENELLISNHQSDELFSSSKEEVEEILQTILKDVSDEEKQWIRRNKGFHSKNVVKK